MKTSFWAMYGLQGDRNVDPGLCMLETNPCPFCARDDGSCRHLLLIIEGEGEDAGGGVLDSDAGALNDAFQEIFENVVRRDAVCGAGILRAATKAFFWGYGFDESGQVHVELERNFAAEYLIDLLDCVPNLERDKADDPPEVFEYVWSESPEPARKLIAAHVKELQRLASLPLGAPEWIPVDLN